MKDRESQLQFNIVWDPGIYNLAVYFTKHHSGSHHQQVRPIYLHEENSPTTMQGCIRILGKEHTNRNPNKSTNELYSKRVTKYAKVAGEYNKPRVADV